MRKITYFGAPGCGKTTTLLNVLTECLKKYSSEEIAFVSFTRKGVNEGKDRAKAMLDLNDKDLPYFRTLHSLAFRFGNYSKHNLIGRSDYKTFSDAMGLKFTGYYTEDFKHNDDIYLFLAALKSNNNKLYHKYIDTYDINIRTLKNVEHNYANFKKAKKLFDFDDIMKDTLNSDLFIPVKVLIIDEAQDLNLLQWQWCEKAFKDAEEWHIGGDDDQAIYEWSGAAVDYFLNLETEHVILNKSYRLPKNIWMFSQLISKNIQHRVDKKIEPSDHKGSIIFCNNLDEIDVQNNDQSWFFLSRNNCFLTDISNHLKKKALVFDVKHKRSVDNNIIRFINLYEKKRKLKNQLRLSDHDRLVLSKYIVNELSFDQPWFNNMRLNNDQIIYYKDLLKYKSSLKSDNIHVNTIHGVKGGEADNVVFIADVTKSINLLIDSFCDAEYRCLYVACTRAKKRLFLVNAIKSKYSFDNIISQIKRSFDNG